MAAAGTEVPSVTAFLGPTNTGKTHAAVERMLEHRTGIIGLPLRLLAREIYDRVSARVGEAAVALVTGEEKRVPPRPRYWVCTAEAMPEGCDVDFAAVDEVQLAGHPERGHVFTDRLLHCRGRLETWFMGADTIRPLVRELVPGADLRTRPRLSTLTSAGSLPLAALPPRTAVVAFSAARVYALGERLRARRGGAAVVLGALSPRTRNAQVALYQSGEVDFLVATDAIGMGLNMDVDHVAFADVRKFDGRENRPLDDAELAQIAGRAGRYQRDGRFATLDPLPPLGAAAVRALESHRFAPQRQVLWRSRELDFGGVEALVASLRRPPAHAGLRLCDDADDLRALLRLARDPDVAAAVRDPARVPLLWDVCQIPDFRQLQQDDHFQLLAAIFRQLAGPHGRIDPDWLDGKMSSVASRLCEPHEIAGADLDTLLVRLAFIRTWTYVCHHAHWVPDAAHWQERARGIEDRLSDALHAHLVRRFVDPAGASRRRRRLRASAAGATAAVTARPAGRSLAEQLRAVVGAPAEAEVPRRRRFDDGWVEALVEAPHDAFRVDDDGRITDAGGVVLGRLGRGADLLHPEVALLLGDDDVGPGARLRLGRRLLAYARDLVAGLLEPLRPAEGAPPLPAAARGLLYQVEHGLGTVRVAAARAQLAALDDDGTGAGRATLAACGVRIGHHLVFAPALLRPAALRTRALLGAACLRPGPAPAVPAAGAVSLAPDPEVPPELYTALGFPLFAGWAVRADVAEATARRLAGRPSPRELLARLRCRPEDLPALRRALRPGRADGSDPLRATAP